MILGYMRPSNLSGKSGIKPRHFTTSYSCRNELGLKPGLTFHFLFRFTCKIALPLVTVPTSFVTPTA